MLTLSYGYQKPQNGDKGSLFYPALAANSQQCNDHNHDGTNTQKLTAQSITAVAGTILIAGWLAAPIAGGLYRQLITMPPNMNFDNYGIQIQIASGANSGHRVLPSIEKVSATTYYVYSNDNSADWTILYLA